METVEIDLQKVPGATDADRARWAKAFQGEQETRANGQAYDEALPRMAELKEQAQATLADLEKSLPGTILDWGIGKQQRKAVDSLRASIAKYREQISDCDKVAVLIKERRPGLSNRTEKADNARFQIREKFKKAEEVKKS